MEKKAHRGRSWKVFGSEQFLRGMWEYFFLKKGRCKGRFQRTLLGQSKKESKVSDNRSLHSKRFWCNSKEVRIQTVVPKRCAVSTSQCSMAIGRFLKKKTGRKESSADGPLKEFGKLLRR